MTMSMHLKLNNVEENFFKNFELFFSLFVYNDISFKDPACFSRRTSVNLFA